MPHRSGRSLWVVVVVGALAALGGCSPHRVRGLVMEGPAAAVMVVDAADRRTQRDGLGGAVVEFTIDPDEMKPRRMSPVATDDQGHFDVPMSEPGAGLLQYQMAVVARMEGFSTVTGRVAMPSSSQRLLIIMTPGRDTYRGKEDVLQETIRMGNELMR